MAYARYHQNPRVFGSRQLGLNFSVQPATVPGSQKSNEEACEKEQERQLLLILEKLENLDNHKSLAKIIKRLNKLEHSQDTTSPVTESRLQELEIKLLDLTSFTQRDVMDKINSVESEIDTIEESIGSGSVAQQLESNEKAIEEVSGLLSALQDQHNTLSGSHESETKEQDLLEDSHQDLTEAHNSLQEKYNSLESLHNTLQSQHDALQSQFDTLKSKIDSVFI